MKKWIGALALVTLLAAAVATGAAGSTSSKGKKSAAFDPTCGAAATKSRDISHTFGVTTLHGTPTRVVALEFSFVDDLADVGVKPVGIADDNKSTSIIAPIRKLVAGYTSVGLRQSPNLETIASLHPDLIIADATRDAKIYHQLQQIAPTIALDSLKEDYLAQLHAAKVIGEAVNKCGAMSARLKQDRLVMKRLKAAVPKTEKRKAMFVVSTKTIFNVHSNLAYTPSLLAAIGIPTANNLKPTTANHANPYIVMSEEDLIANNPDIMFVANYPPAPTVWDTWLKDPLASVINAVKNKEVFDVNPYLWSKARGIKASEMIAQQAVRLLYHKYVPIKLPKLSLK